MLNDVTFIVLSFEGPDPYSHAGGLGSRVNELSGPLAAMGFETHLFFVGHPELPGHEVLEGGKLHLHRWCQWISQHYPSGVYDGEEDKLQDWDRSLPSWLEEEVIGPKVAGGGSVVVLAEEWHTANSIISLHDIAVRCGWQGRVHLLWNANNTFSFQRIDWERLKSAATITTVSRYMKHVMLEYDVNPRIIPNGISESWLHPVDASAHLLLSRMFQGRLTVAKVARWDPDKGWNAATDAVAELKRLGLRPLFLARGGIEAHRFEVLARAQGQGLGVASVHWKGAQVKDFAEAVRPALAADVVNLQGYLSQSQRRALYRTVDVVLANSRMEPFGLVGLETMAVGGCGLCGQHRGRLRHPWL